MKEKDINQLFEEKLRNHQVTPNPGLWDQLEESLQPEKGSKMIPVIFWKVAAVLLLVSSVAIFTVIYQEKDTTPMAVKKPVKPSTEQPIADKRTDSNTRSQKLTSGGAVAQHDDGMQEQGTQEKKEEKSDDLRKHHPKTAVEEKGIMPNQTNPAHLVAMVERVSSQPSNHLPVSLEAKDLTDRSLPVGMEPMLAVTVTYKGEAPESMAKGNNTFAFLDNLKAPSLSEIRQAKNELISKAFSSRND